MWSQLEVHLYGSLALTGRGHATDRAVLLGLMGQAPETVDGDTAEALVRGARQRLGLNLAGRHPVDFDESCQLVFHADQALPQHPNGMRLFAADAHGQTLADLTMFSIGGGFIVDAKDFPAGPQPVSAPWPLPYRSGAELLQLCAQEGCSIAELALRNELALRSRDEVDPGPRRDPARHVRVHGPRPAAGGRSARRAPGAPPCAGAVPGAAARDRKPAAR